MGDLMSDFLYRVKCTKGFYDGLYWGANGHWSGTPKTYQLSTLKQAVAHHKKMFVMCGAVVERFEVKFDEEVKLSTFLKEDK